MLVMTDILVCSAEAGLVASKFRVLGIKADSSVLKNHLALVSPHFHTASWTDLEVTGGGRWLLKDRLMAWPSLSAC